MEECLLLLPFCLLLCIDNILYQGIMSVNQLKAGAFLSYLIIGINTFIGLVYTPFMLRTMGQSEYGLYSLAASVIAYLTVLDLGFGNAIVRYTSKYRAEGKVKEQEEMFGMFLLLYSFISIIAIVLGILLYTHVEQIFSRAMNADEIFKVQVMMLLLTLNLAFTFPMSLWGSIITAYENFIFQRIISIVRIVMNPAVMVIFLLFGYKAITMVVITTVFNVLTLIANYVYCRNRLHIRVRFGKFKWGFLKEVSVYSFWIFLNIIMDRIYWSTGQFVLGIYRGAAMVAVYAVAIQLQQMFMMFSGAISNVFLPRITSMVSHHRSDEEISDLFIRTGRIQYIVMSLILSGFIVFGRSFIILWAGEEYEEVYIIALLFFVPLTVPLIQNVGISILQARNQMKFRSLLYLCISILSLGFSIFGAKQYGAIGCAVATAGALILGQIIIMNIYYQKKQRLNIVLFWKEIGRMSVVPFLVVIVFIKLTPISIFSSEVMNMIVGITLFILVYIPSCWAFSMNKHEREIILAPLQNIKNRFS